MVLKIRLVKEKEKLSPSYYKEGSAQKLIGISSQPKVRIVKRSAFSRFLRSPPPKVSKINKGIANFARGSIKARKQPLIYARDFQRPLIGQAKRAGRGKGRPAGPSGKYYIPGVGPVGVYEYRRYLGAQNRIRVAQAQTQLQQARLNPTQRFALQQLQDRQNAQQQDPEQRTIPDSNGKFRLQSLHQEAEDAANIFP